MPPKKTAFFDIHSRLGAKIVDFAGFAMPVLYSGIVEEHRLVRSAVGVFDVSHMGEVEVHGSDALAFVQKMTTNDASRLQPGRVQYSAMCYDDGGIVDDLLVYRLDEGFMLVINAANCAKDIEWLRSHLSGDVTLTDHSDATSLLAIQGPQSLKTLQKICSVDLAPLEYYHFLRADVAGTKAIVSRTGYTGELGYEIYFPSDVATGEKVWNAVMNAGKEFGIGPVGLGARDTLRLEMGFCLYGHDIDQTTNPIEAGLGWITKVDKGDFSGKGPILKAKNERSGRKLVGFRHSGKAFPRQGYTINANGKKVGTVTSGTFSPTLPIGIGMGYVDAQLAGPGSNIAVVIRDREEAAVVTKLPFITK